MEEKGWTRGRRGLAAGLIAGSVAGAMLLAPAVGSAKPANGAGKQAAQAGASAKAAAADRKGPGECDQKHDLTEGPLAVAAEAIGIDVQTLADAVHQGATIAEVATDNGVDVQTVIAAMVTDAQEHIAGDVEDGKLTQGQADELLANLEDHITGVVNGETPPGPPPGRF